MNRTITLSVAAVALAALAGCAEGDAGEVASTPRGTPLATSIVGAWKPLEVGDYTEPTKRPDNPAHVARIRFTKHGSWGGSDGCNHVGGEYAVIEPDGLRMDKAGVVSSSMACLTPSFDARTLGLGVRTVTVDGDTLTLTDASGAVLGTFERVGAD